MVTGQWVDPRAGKETPKAFAERWRKRQIHADSTEGSIKIALTNRVYPALGAMGLDQVTTEGVQTLVKTWSTTAAPTTVKNRYLVLATVLRAAPHDLRHYFASVHISGGTSIQALQAMLGHKSASETRDTYGQKGAGGRAGL